MKKTSKSSREVYQCIPMNWCTYTQSMEFAALYIS